MESITKLYQEAPALLLSLFQMVLQPQGRIAHMINAIIMFLAALVFIWAVSQAILFFISWCKLSALKKMLAKDENKVWTPEEINSLARERSYVTRRLKNKLQAIQGLREDVNAVLELFDHLDSSIRWRAYGILKFPISSLIVFGLLGTVWGLQKAIYHLLPTIKGTIDIDQLKFAMLGTLTGMQTAFSTTLAGLICSIALGLFILVALKTFIEKQLVSEKQFLVEKIIPIYSPISSAQLTRISDQTKELKSTVGDIANQRDLLFQPIIESANSLKSSVDNFHTASHSIVEVSTTVRDLGNVIDNNLSQLSNTLDGVNKSMNTFMTVQTDIEGSLKNLNNLPGHFELLMKTLTEEFKKYQSDLQASSEKMLGQKIESLSSVIESLSDQSAKWQQENLNHVASVSDATDSILAKVETEVGQLVDKFADIAANMDKVNDKVLNNIETLNASHNKVGEAYLDAFKQKMEHIQSNFTSLVERLSQDEHHRNQQIVNALTEWIAYNQFLSKMLNNMEQLPNRIGNVITGKAEAAVG